MGVTVEIKGVEATAKMLKDFEKDLKKTIRSEMRKAAKPWKSQIRNSISEHAKWVELLEQKITSRRGRIKLVLGLMGHPRGEDVNGNEKDMEWYHAYWKEYGTITHRDPTHRFVRSVKNNVRGRKNNVGQMAEHFFAKATDRAAEDISSKVAEAIDKKLTEFEKQINQNGDK